jgi:lysophospholipase L1-like esterase
MFSASSLRPLALLALAAFAPASAGAEEIDYEQEAAIEARLQQYLPRTLPRLQRRARVRVVVVGDDVSRYGFGFRENPRRCWHYQFLDRMAAKYFYGGGVRLAGTNPPPLPQPLAEGETPPLRILPPRGEIPPLDEVINGSPEIVLHNFSRKGATAIQALQPLTTEAFDERPDLVLWMYGLNDALTEVPVEAYQMALEAAVKLCREQQVDLIIAGPSLIYGDDLHSITTTLAYSRAAANVAAKEKLLFCDMTAALGDLPLKSPSDPSAAYNAYLEPLKNYFKEGAALNLIHPNAMGHTVMAETSWAHLLGQTPPPAITARGSYTLATQPTKEEARPVPNLEISLLQASSEETPAPLVSDAVLTILEQSGGWKRAGDNTFIVKPFTDRRTMRMPLASSVDTASSLPLGSTTSAGFILYQNNRAQLLSIDAVIVPIAIELPLQRIESVAGDLLIDGIITSKQKEEFRATAEIDWLGKKTEMAIALEGNSSKPLKLRLALPEGNSLHAPLVVRLKSGEHTYMFTRTIDATRNFLPEQKLPFTGQDGVSPTVKLLTKVDPTGLFCTFELPPAQSTGGSVSLMIDARDPIERGKLGFVDTLTFPLPAQDGAIQFKKVPAAVFGSGYDREIDPTSILAVMRTLASGQRLVEIAIPKQNFYLHQWSISDRGQNKLGFNALVRLPDLPAPLTLTRSAFSLNDTSSLGVLQLIPKSTGEWSVRVY